MKQLNELDTNDYEKIDHGVDEELTDVIERSPLGNKGLKTAEEVHYAAKMLRTLFEPLADGYVMSVSVSKSELKVLIFPEKQVDYAFQHAVKMMLADIAEGDRPSFRSWIQPVEAIAHATFNRVGKAWAIGMAGVRTSHQSQGLMLLAYTALVTKKKYTLVAKGSQSEGARKLWMRLADQAGVFVYGWDDKEQQAFHLFGDDDDGRLTGHKNVYTDEPNDREQARKEAGAACDTEIKQTPVGQEYDRTYREYFARNRRSDGDKVFHAYYNAMNAYDKAMKKCVAAKLADAKKLSPGNNAGRVWIVAMPAKGKRS